LIVVDASFIIAHVLGEDAAIEQADLITTLRQGKLIAPAHWPAEISNALITNVRRKRISLEDVGLILHELAAYDIEVRQAFAGEAARLVAISSEQNLTAYDAAYVILAMDLKASIATLDKAMRQAALRLNLNVLPV
jgi:predicted nucleic acid-binding protein